MTRAFPKIASYAFTTLHPHFGTLKFNDTFELSIADLPGLIEGASQNKGLGHRFLKHVERTKILIFILDGSNPSTEERNPLDDLICLFTELSLYDRSLVEKPYLIVIILFITNLTLTLGSK